MLQSPVIVPDKHHVMQTFDFIIVGAGSSGCVLAERLSASGKYSVLVLEAGGSDMRFFVQMPLGYGKTFFDPTVNWMYKAEPDPGLAGNADNWPRGKVLGGSSSINAMVWIRGAREDYEEWEALGNTGWGWQEMSGAFKALEDNGDGSGPVRISRIDDKVHPLTHRYLDAAQAAGLPLNDDFNAGTQEGVGLYRMTIKGGRRHSSARAFLKQAKKRANVKVETNALATRILFEGKRAVGIEYIHNGVTKSVRTGRDVILAGGSVNNPQLLQLSGIGDPDLLKSLEIPVQHANVNVGQHLADHQGINYTYKANVPTLNQELRPLLGKLLAGMKYIFLGTGPLSMSLNQGGGFFRTSDKYTRPNMQLYFQAFSTVIPKPGERPILNPDPWPGFSIGLSNCRTSSRGHIAIRSRSPLDHPKIVANAFSHPDDVEEMLDAVKFVRKIAAQAPMAQHIVEELLPGPAVQTDEDLIADFRKRSGTVYHPVSTCRMGPDAADSVVAPDLKVHGLEGLRICDASIFPTITTGNTNAPAIAVGWLGAKRILEDHS